MAKFGIVLSQTPIQVNLRRLLRIICGRKPAFLHRLPKMSEEIPPQSSPTANVRMRIPLKVGSNGGWETTRGRKKKKTSKSHPSASPSFPLQVHLHFSWTSERFAMGTGKKEATRRSRQGKTGDGLGNVRVKGENFYRCVFYFSAHHCPVHFPPFA